jgi:hypothetical protein
MKTSFTFLSALAVLLTSTTATPLQEHQDLPRSTSTIKALHGPFALKMKTTGTGSTANAKSFNNKYVSGTHIGAAIDLAIPAGAASKVFYINGTEDGYVGTDAYGKKIQYGRLMYNVDYPAVPYMGGIQYNLSSNLAELWLSVVDPLYNFGIDSKGKLVLGIFNGEKDTALSRWQGCTSDTNYGPKQGLNWQFGKGSPTEKDCVGVEIYKV